MHYFCLLLQDSPSSSLRYTLDTTESLQDKAFSSGTQESALATQLSILKDRMDDIEVRRKRSMQNSNTRKVSDYIEDITRWREDMNFIFE